MLGSLSSPVRPRPEVYHAVLLQRHVWRRFPARITVSRWACDGESCPLCFFPPGDGERLCRSQLSTIRRLDGVEAKPTVMPVLDDFPPDHSPGSLRTASEIHLLFESYIHKERRVPMMGPFSSGGSVHAARVAGPANNIV